MKTIFITSAGFRRRIIREEIARVIPSEQFPVVSYIPTASRVVEDDSYARDDVERMQELGYMVHEVDLAEYVGQPAALEESLRRGNALYVQGGNPYWLLKQARESGFMEVVPKLIEEGMPYIGKSAGAYLLAPEIVPPTWYSKEWRTFGVTDRSGMRVVPFIWAAHYNPEDAQMRSDVAHGAATSP